MKRRLQQAIAFTISQWWMVIAIGVLATLVLILFLGKGQDLWFDENYSVMLAKRSFFDVISLTGVDAHPPLYYMLLKVWGSIFGWSELAVRSLSAVLAAAAVGLMALFIRRLFTPRIALVTLPFLVLAPFWLRYGYEVRMYALAGLIGVGASFALAQAVKLKNDKRWWALYAVLVAAGMYTLYMTAVIWISHLVWLAIYQRRRFWRQPWFLSAIGAGVLFLPYLPTFIYQNLNSALPGTIGWQMDLTHMWEIVSTVLIYTPEWSVPQWASIIILAVLGLTIYLLDRSRHQMTAQSRRSLNLLLCLAFVPLALFFLMSITKSEPFFVPRYLAHISLFFYAIIGVAVALGWRYGYRKASVLLFVLGMVLLGWGLVQLVLAGNFNYERMQFPQTSKVRRAVTCNKDTVVVTDDSYTYINDQYYFQGCDLRFYAPDDIWYWGAYAMLTGSKAQLRSPSGVSSQRIVHLYWKDKPVFHPDSRYRLISSVTYDYQVTDTYQLK